MTFLLHIYQVSEVLYDAWWVLIWVHDLSPLKLGAHYCHYVMTNWGKDLERRKLLQQKKTLQQNVTFYLIPVAEHFFSAAPENQLYFLEPFPEFICARFSESIQFFSFWSGGFVASWLLTFYAIASSLLTTPVPRIHFVALFWHFVRLALARIEVLWHNFFHSFFIRSFAFWTVTIFGETIFSGVTTLYAIFIDSPQELSF